MNIDHVPVSPHNAHAWKLSQIDMDMTFRTPDQNGVLTICDYSKQEKMLAELSLATLSDNRGFSVQRADGVPIQAQYVRPNKPYLPDGMNVFIEPVEFVEVHHDFVTDRWRVDVEPENVADPVGLNTFVWALAHYGLKKKTKLLRTTNN